MRLEETVVKARRANVWFMPSGPLPDDPSGLLGGKRMDDLIWEMRRRFDYILVTAPSIHRFADAGTLVSFADHAVLVTSYRRHSISRLRKASLAIEACGVSVSGILLGERFTGLSSRKPASSRHHAPALTNASSGRGT
jgi:Mrp family chromosome partitioning ATPase